VARCSWRRRGAQRGPRAALHGSSTAAEQGGTAGVTCGRKKGCSRGGWAPFIAGIGGGRRRRGSKSGGGEMAAGNQWRRWCHGSDRLPAVCVSEGQLSGRWARAILTGWVGTVDMGWVQSGAIFFQLFKLCSNFKIQNKDHPYVHKCSNLAWC
jgi:hypothetical protein